MAQYHHILRDDGSVVEIAWTDRSDGNFHIDDPDGGLVARRAAVMDRAWAVVHQVHGNVVIDATAAVGTNDLIDADGLTTASPEQPIAVQGADCAPIAFITDEGPIGVAHAGWRGLAAGIIRNVVERLSESNATTVEAVVGPVICVDCYEFGSDDLDDVADQLGDVVRAQTQAGTPALDMRAAITASFDRVDVTKVSFVGGCPGCDETGFSHRVRQDPERHCLVARLKQ